MRQKAVRANIKDVASVAGVSTQTVSRVINERPDVSPETRKRVKEVIEQVGYQPSALARSLISQRSHTLGVVIAGLKYIGPSSALSGIASAAEEAGYSLLLKELPRFDTDDIEPIFQAFLSRHVDGIIWAVSEVGDNRKWMNNPSLNLEIPLVYLTMEPRQEVTVVSVNNYQGGRLAVSHLLEQGYKNIGHVSGPLEWWEARQRMKAWRDVLSEAGISVEERHWVEGNWSSASGAVAVEKLFEQYPEMDAIFVANDQMSLSALQVIAKMGLKIPEDIGVVGFDNIPESAYFWPALTTVQQDQYKVAKVAVEEMIKIIELGWQEVAPIYSQSIMIEPSLVVRRSSARLENINYKGGG
ncbi:MAG: LacI family DNA-binding transcriptional regulator [Anaerolineales bacterium]